MGIILGSGGNLQFAAEPGFSLSGDIVDGGDVVVSGSGFGTKPQAAPKVFDTFDIYYNNGTPETPYSALNDGDTLPSTASDPYDNHPVVWTKDVSGAYGRRSAAYKSPVDTAGGNFDYWMDNWRGWATPTGNRIYLRWNLWVEEEGFNLDTLNGNHATSATDITVNTGSVKFTDLNAVGRRIVIELDDSSLHRTTLSVTNTTTNFTIADALPSAAASGKRLYFSDLDSTKFVRVWDDAGASQNLLRVSWTWGQLTTTGPATNGEVDTPLNVTAGGVGSWNLMEATVFMPTDEVDKATGEAKVWHNRTLINTISGDISDPGGTWPFGGVIPRLIGQDTSAPAVKWRLGPNFLRLAEMYADTSYQRIEIGDHPSDLFLSTIREVCMLNSWVDSGVGFKVNQGRHNSIVDKYLYRVDGNDVDTLLGQFI